MIKKSPEQEKFEQIYLPEDFYGEEEDDTEYCDYGGEECVKPDLKHINLCFECWFYQEMIQEMKK